MVPMRMWPVLVYSLLVCGCFSEGPEGEDPTGDDDTTSASDPSMTSTSTASTTTVDPVTTSPTSDVTGTPDPTDMTMTTEDPTSDVTTMTADATTDADSSSTEPPIEEDVFQDFLAEADGAIWTNDLQAVLDFPVYSEDAAASSGHAYLVSLEHQVAIESTKELFTDDAMLLHPRYAADGEVRGQYDGIVYMAGDRFRTHAYCVQEVGCSVELVISHSIKQSPPAEITSFSITADDVDGIDIDFELEGGGFTPGLVTQLSLIVRAGPDSGSDSLLLERPRIVRGE